MFGLCARVQRLAAASHNTWSQTAKAWHLHDHCSHCLSLVFSVLPSTSHLPCLGQTTQHSETEPKCADNHHSTVTHANQVSVTSVDKSSFVSHYGACTLLLCLQAALCLHAMNKITKPLLLPSVRCCKPKLLEQAEPETLMLVS